MKVSENGNPLTLAPLRWSGRCDARFNPARDSLQRALLRAFHQRSAYLIVEPLQALAILFVFAAQFLGDRVLADLRDGDIPPHSGAG